MSNLRTVPHFYTLPQHFYAHNTHFFSRTTLHHFACHPVAFLSIIASPAPRPTVDRLVCYLSPYCLCETPLVGAVYAIQHCQGPEEQYYQQYDICWAKVVAQLLLQRGSLVSATSCRTLRNNYFLLLWRSTAHFGIWTLHARLKTLSFESKSLSNLIKFVISIVPFATYGIWNV